MKCAAWSELPRAIVNTAVGFTARNVAPNSRYAVSSRIICAATTAGASRDSTYICDAGAGVVLLAIVKRNSFHKYIGQLQITIEHNDIGPRIGDKPTTISEAEKIGSVGRYAPRGIA